jgi:hypothetical protein
MKSYLLSLPERLVRSACGLGAGIAREVSDVVLPDRLKQTQLYQNLVDTTLRFLIEQVGQVDGVYQSDAPLEGDFFKRRVAGNAIEALGIVAFRASPVWVLAALADVCGAGRQLIPEITDALKKEGLLDSDTSFSSVDDMLDGLERTSGRLASTVNTPPLDVAALREEWQALRKDAGRLQPTALPSPTVVSDLWRQLQSEADRQRRTIFETSSMLAVSAIKSVPEGARWLTASAAVGATRTGQIVAGGLLDHYRTTLDEIREVGYATFAARQLGPYVRAAVGQFSPERVTLTERFLNRRAGNAGASPKSE